MLLSRKRSIAYKRMFNNTILIAQANISLKYDSKIYFPCVLIEMASKKSAWKLPSNRSLELSHQIQFVHQGHNNIWTYIIVTRKNLPLYLVVFLYFFLLAISALCSGLNIGNCWL